MVVFKKKILIVLSILFLFPISSAFSDNHNLKEILEIIQKDLKTLERAVYSDNISNTDQDSSTEIVLDQNSEEVLTRHLLKLSEIEMQFQELTNRFEEINFKLDKLSSRLSKVQADNQLRFQQLEKTLAISTSEESSKIASSTSQTLEKKKMIKYYLDHQSHKI